MCRPPPVTLSLPQGPELERHPIRPPCGLRDPALAGQAVSAALLLGAARSGGGPARGPPVVWDTHRRTRLWPEQHRSARPAGRTLPRAPGCGAQRVRWGLQSGVPQSTGMCVSAGGSWGPPRTAVQVLHCVLGHVRQRPCSPAPHCTGAPRWGSSLTGPGFRVPSAHSLGLWAPGHTPTPFLPRLLSSPLVTGGGWYLHPPSQWGAGIFVPLVSGGRYLYLKDETAGAQADCAPHLPLLHGPGLLLSSPGLSPCCAACGRTVWCGRLASFNVFPGEPWASSPLAPKLTVEQSRWLNACVASHSVPFPALAPGASGCGGQGPAQQGDTLGEGSGLRWDAGGPRSCAARGGGWRGAPHPSSSPTGGRPQVSALAAPPPLPGIRVPSAWAPGRVHSTARPSLPADR